MGASESTPTKARSSSAGPTPIASPASRPKSIKFDPGAKKKSSGSPSTVRSGNTVKSSRSSEKQVTFSDRIEKKKIGHLRQVSLPEKPDSPVLKSSLKNSSSYSTPASPVDGRNFVFPGADATGESASCDRRDSSRRQAVYLTGDVMPVDCDSLTRDPNSGRVFLVSDNTCVFTRHRKPVAPRPVSASGPSTPLEFTHVRHVPVYVSSIDSLCYKKREKQTTEVETQTEESPDVRQRPKRTESPLSRSRRSSGYASANGSPTVSRIELPDNVFAESTAVSIQGVELGSELALDKTAPQPIPDEEFLSDVTVVVANTEPETPAASIPGSLDKENGPETPPKYVESKTRKNYRGFLRIQLNLTRPISVVAGTTPPSLYDLLQADDATSMAGKELTSFFLPRGAFKSVHVTSETTTGQLIQMLLKKFHVVDDPRKFALYEKYAENGDTTKVRLRRMELEERPLHIVKRWQAQELLGVFSEEKAELMKQIPSFISRSFVLQENDTGDIMWDAFAVPELQTFLKILDREEAEYRKQIVQKYKNLRSYMNMVAESKRSGAVDETPPPKLATSSSSESEDDECMTMKRNRTLPQMAKFDSDRFANADDSDDDCDATLKPVSSKRFL